MSRTHAPGSDEFAISASGEVETGQLSGESLERMRTRLHLIEVTPLRIDYLCSALRKRGFDARQ